MSDITLKPCCQKAFADIQKTVQLAKNAEKFPELVKLFGKGAPKPLKVPADLYVKMTKATTAGGIKIARARAIRAVAEQHQAEHPSGPLGDFWMKMAGF